MNLHRGHGLETEDPAVDRRRGFALIAVLFVLMALFLLTTPFLFTATSAERASAAGRDRARVQLALDTAGRHARAVLSRSHGSLDPTPWSDSVEELTVDSEFPGDPYDAHDPHGSQWDLDSQDVAGLIDLNSAPPQVIGNLLGATAGLAVDLEKSATKLELTSTAGLETSGFVWLGSELVGYGGIEGNTLTGLLRGVGVILDNNSEPDPCGPSLPVSHALGETVVDQRAEAIPAWRTGGNGLFRELDGIEHAVEAQALVIAGAFAPDDLSILRETTSVFAAIGAGARWQAGTRLTADIDGSDGDLCRLSVDDGRWFNPGTTVRISGNGFSEVALVRGVGRNSLRLDRPLVGSYRAFSALVQPLARRPVNINTASNRVLLALVENLRLRGNSSFLTTREAEQLVEVIVLSRPFDGLEDFLRRVVLPAAGLAALPDDAPTVPDVFARPEVSFEDAGPTGFMDREDAIALYKNALNANDGELSFSTMPFAFTSRDVHRLSLRASVAAKSGVNRGSAVREDVLLAAPQEPLLAVWSSQAQFDEAGRQHRTMPGWVTGPVNTVRPDLVYHSWHPTEARAHLGPNDTQPYQVSAESTTERAGSFPERESDVSWATLATVREDPEQRHADRQLHFDHEQRSGDGRYLPDGIIQRNPSDMTPAWATNDGLARAINLRFWLRPEQLVDGATFLDMGGAFPSSDRITLLFEDGDLVLRALDAAGDHPDTVFEEISEVRYAFDAQQGPGVQPDTWLHVQIEVTGTKPSQMVMLIDGQSWSRTPGLTRLIGGLSADSGTIHVESTEGFPERCVLRIGFELIEAVRTGDGSFRAQAELTGPLAGFGGRLARETFTGVDPGVNAGVLRNTAHPAGSAVELYGYAAPLSSNVPAGGGLLGGDLGPFAVARIRGIQKGGDKDRNQMEPITLQTTGGQQVTVGYGLDGVGNDVQALILASADEQNGGSFMSAFSTSGGYAAILSRSLRVRLSDLGTGTVSEPLVDINGSPLGGIEVIRYSGWNGNKLILQKRGDAVSELANVGTASTSNNVGGRRAFIAYWEDFMSAASSNLSLNERLSYQTLVVPISVPVTGANASTFLIPSPGLSEFAQITRRDGESDQTEWVRYDEVVQNQLVRDEPNALLTLQSAALGGRVDGQVGGTIPGPDDGPGGKGGFGGIGEGTGGGTTGGGAAPRSSSVPQPEPPPTPPAVPAEPLLGSYWEYRIGQPEDTNLPVARAVATQFQFRGVFGTSSHTHGTGTAVLPVWQLPRGDISAGRAGRFDSVFFFSNDPSDPGFSGTIHFAHQPLEVTVAAYTEGTAPLSADPVEDVSQFQTGVRAGVTYVALEQPLAVPIAPGSPSSTGQGLPVADTRLFARVLKFPSGERPRVVVNAQLGGPAVRGATGSVPSATIDEVAFGAPLFGQAQLGEGGQGGQLILERPLLDGDDVIEVLENRLRTGVGDIRVQTELLSELPADGGLLRVGKEIIAYDSYDTDSDLILIPPGGRGLLGTQVDGHSAGEGIGVIEFAQVGFLSADISAQDAILPVKRWVEPSRGTVLIDQELIHYDWNLGNALAMPSRSKVAGANDGSGGGLWRGRFGTVPAGHAAGTPVIFFHTRYWDRWADRADGPELSYLQVGLDAPATFWRRVFFEAEDAGIQGPRLAVLQRTDPDLPWDAVPNETPGLRLLTQAGLEEGGVPIAQQSERIDWRVFIRYEPGSFDATTGTRLGWKVAPRLRMIGAEYLSPWMLLERVER